jgi:tetratricopeptide (TPR) repeat protein
MSDPQRIESARVPDASSVPDREARIEQLLLSGLDHYFAGNYDQAINVWTRVIFLERGHDRARAYIERARSALAERHRESEELLDQGIAAFNRGENDLARELITRVVERDGGNHELALVFLERLNRLQTAPAKAEMERRLPSRRREETPANGQGRGAWIAIALFLAGAGVATLGAWPIGSWLAELPVAEPEQVRTVEPDPVPIAHSSQLALSRARALYVDGHLHDALRLLDSVAVGDPLKAEADQLRADVQQRLLESARRSVAPTAPEALR